MSTSRLRGAIAASVTPLRNGGRTLDTMAFEPLTSFLSSAGVDGVLACGTTGEGVLMSVAERRTVTELFLDTRPKGFRVAVHAGAQTTADTVALAAHAQEVGADAVAVIAPPYYPLDDEELTRHLAAAANASDPLPFYAYEFAGRSGYAIPPAVVLRVKAAAPNVVGMKVSDLPFAAVRPYMDLGLDVFVGQEPLAIEGMQAGGVGCVSGLAAAFPETVARLVHDRDAAAHDAVVMLRERLAGIPFHAALKEVLMVRDVLLRADVRPPLRGLTDAERDTVLGVAREIGAV
jgi:dihydrodipicolinate synthase/N-acetylneuraminate lyase